MMLLSGQRMQVTRMVGIHVLFFIKLSKLKVNHTIIFMYLLQEQLHAQKEIEIKMIDLWCDFKNSKQFLFWTCSVIKKGISQFKELSSGMKKRNTELKEKRKAVDEAKSVWIMLGRLKSLKHLITPLIYLLCNDC